MRKLLNIACVLLIAYTAQAQEKIFLHPNKDPHWYYVVNETFDSTLDKGTWNSRVPWGPTDTVKTCDNTNYPNGIVTNFDIYAATTKGFKNFSIDSGIGTLQTRREQYKGEVWRYDNYYVDTLKKDSLRLDSVWFNYTTGLLFSDSLYKYGYYEIKCKLPEAPANDLDKYNGLGPNFWLWSGGGDRYSEIDIFEIETHDASDNDGQPNNRFTHNFHYKCDTLPNCPADSFLHGAFYADYFNVKFDEYKTFASYWSENSIEYYYEDSLLHTSSLFPQIRVQDLTMPINSQNTWVQNYRFNHSSNFYPMHIIVDNYVPGRQFCTSHDSTTSMPYDYLIDHIKVWLLKNACDSVLIIPEIDPANYDYTVKQKIELGNGGGVLNNGENLILRANEAITLKPGYEAKYGSELTLLISDCMEAGGVFDSENKSGQKEFDPNHSINNSFYKPIKYDTPWESY
tara:strand:+ start:183 stop:1547 length:1365 start_codon:yes stop_codon:yes gene_type:complete